jgi:integrase
VDKLVHKPFKKITKDDMISFCSKRNHIQSNSEYKCIKIFFQWLYGLKKGRYPECVEWITFNGRHKHKLPEEMLTKEDILKLIQAARTIRDKAILHVLYETGARAGELCAIQIKHVKFDQTIKAKKAGGVIVEWIPIFLRGKTGERIVYLQDSIPLLRQWLNEHPDPSNPNTPLFVSSKKLKALSSADVLGQIIDRAVKTTGIQKRIHPHLFRHSRATELASSMTEQELKIWFGWSGGSTMPAVYTHLSASNLLDKLKRMSGISKNNEDENILSPKTCTKCGEVNLPTFSYCKSCGVPLSVQKALEDQEKQRKRMDFLDKLMSMADKDEKWKGIKKEVFG